ncbi:MAG: hypothetical protein ACTHJ4_00075, partial [Candidatus Nucleicultricaceae bacterium]
MYYYVMRGVQILLLTCCLASAVCASEDQANIPIKITSDLCADLLVEHTPSVDTQYQAGVDVDGEVVVPADFGGGLKIDIPKTMTIPIQFDLARFLGVPPDVTVANHKELTSSLDQLTQDNTALQNTTTTISNDLAAVTATTKAIRTLLSQKNLTPQQITQLNQAISQNAQALKGITNQLDAQPDQLSGVSTLLTENASILDSQFNAYEKDPLILEKNRVFKDQSIAQTEASLENLSQTLGNFDQLKNSLNENKELLMQSSNVLSHQDYKNLSQNFETLSGGLDTLQNKFELQSLINEPTTDGTGDKLTLTDQLNDVQKNLTGLNESKNRYVNNMEIGEVEYVNGKLYFNNQP